MTTAFTDKAKTIVISIFSALLGLMLFCSPVFADQINNSDDEVITLDLLKKAQRSLEFFKGTQKRYNKNLLEAIDWGTFNKEMQFDIWANQICYLTAGKKNSNYILTSAGPDGQFLTWDDIDAPADSARHSLKYEHMMKSENKYIKVMIASELGAYKGEGLDVTEFLSGAMPREKSVTLVKEVIKKLEADKELGTRLKKAIIEKRKSAMDKEAEAFTDFKLFYFSLNSRDFEVEKDAFLTDMLLDAGTAAKYITKLQKGY